jgi:peptide/nickel transport system substrate-binding protein
MLTRIAGEREKNMLRTAFAARAASAAGLWAVLAGVAFADFQQAPMLDALVESGALPPVEERLPLDPFVETMVDGIGTYGGTLRTTILAGGDHYNLTRTVANELLVRWTPDWKEVVPSIARDVEVSEDATTYTFHLREGMRWSDGAPFTADDIMFWYEDVFMNEALSPSKNPVFVKGGQPVVVEKIDDQTVVFRFASPYGLFLQQLAYGQGHLPIIYPKHYLSQFHETYNAEGLPALIEADATAADWVALFNSKISLTFQPPYWQNLELPTLNPWVLTVPYADGDRVEVSRNPYYWKVDTEGNQLPYIDEITWERIDDPQLMALNTTLGEYDFVFRHVNNATFQSVLFDGQEQGNYRFLEVQDLAANDTVLMLNLNAEDPVKREVFQNRDFRIAVSHAVNRQEIMDLIYLGQGDPAQAAPQPIHELYNERMATQFTEFNPDLANEILDGIMPERGADGFRLGPDGQPFTIVWMVADVFGMSYPDVMLMVKDYLADVGINIELRSADRARLNTMWYANEQEAYIWNCVGGMSEAYTDVRCYMPFQKADIFFAMKWADWYSDPSTGEEPPQEIKDLFAAYDRVAATTDATERTELMKAFLDLSADQFLNIGIRRGVPKFAIVSNDLRNVVEPIPIAGNLWHPAPTLTQWYFDRAD